jgi:hypothetical protein
MQISVPERAPAADQEAVSITRLNLIRRTKQGHCVDHDELAFMDLAIGGCHFNAELLRDGSLQLPGGVSIPPAARKRAKQAARELALAELAKAWSEQRDAGEVFDERR